MNLPDINEAKEIIKLKFSNSALPEDISCTLMNFHSTDELSIFQLYNYNNNTNFFLSYYNDYFIFGDENEQININFNTIIDPYSITEDEIFQYQTVLSINEIYAMNIHFFISKFTKVKNVL